MKAIDVGYGAVIVAGSAMAGAVVGAAVNPPCTGSAADPLFCGPQMGGVFGAAYGITAAGVGGLLVAALSPKKRNLGLGTASVVGGLLVVGVIRRALAPPSLPTGAPVASLAPVSATQTPVAPVVVPVATQPGQTAAVV